MTVSQYSDPYLSDCYTPVTDELSVANLTVRGEIPTELNGMLVQNSPNPRYSPPGRYHWFDGDGMVHGVRFSNGAASYTNQYVRTRHFDQEESAGRPIWKGLLEPIDPALGDAPDKDTANTDLVWHNDKLLALWWLSGQPYRIDPLSLKTLGPETFGGTQQCNVASHPKVCPVTGDMMFIDFDVYRPPYLRYGVVSGDGKMVHHEVIDVPGPRLFHDIAITANHTVLMDLPMYWVDEAMKAGKRRIWFDSEMPSRFGIVPRFGDNSQVRWFETEACYIYHSIHAWEEGDEVVMTACRIDNPLPTQKYEDDPGVPRLYFLRLEPYLHMWRFNLKTGQVREQRLDDVPTEFPRVNDNYLGQKSRYAYNPRLAKEPTLLFDAVLKYDLEKGNNTVHEYGDGRFGGEPVFVPRAGATAEDDGFLVVFVNDRTSNTTSVEVLDATDLDAGPLAVVSLPRRVPVGFHVCWAPGNGGSV